ncbi:MAG: SURF1 family protein [Gemmatimonadaceae bacterium]|nr:SURF1 family protein [Gemmatimonadaceae bacterium]
MTRARMIVFGVLTVVASAVCVRLGIWQLSRLQERRAKNAVMIARGAMPAVSVSALRAEDTTATHWRRATLRGVADYAHEAVYATRSQAGSPGVYLLTPVRPLDADWGDTAVLLLRGYVYAADGRTIDHAKAREGDTLALEGLITSFTVTKPGTVRLPSLATAVRTLDRDTLSAITGAPLAPFVLLALGDTTVRDVTRPARVPPPAITDGPHLSYALQWFGFATVFLVGYGFFATGAGRRPRRSENVG